MSRPSRERLEQLRNDEDNWKLGFVYICREDPAFLVPKRLGIGWTINLGSVWAIPAVIVILLVIAWGITY